MLFHLFYGGSADDEHEKKNKEKDAADIGAWGIADDLRHFSAGCRSVYSGGVGAFQNFQ